MLPPPSGTLKRKTLAEQAGEVNRAAPPPPSLRSGYGSVKATTLAGLSRDASFSSSASSSKPPSTSSIRNVSNSSFSSSVGTSRPISSHGHRYNASVSTATIPKPTLAPRRPASSFDNLRPEYGRASKADGNKNSMPLFHSTSNHQHALRESVSFANFDRQSESILQWSTSVPRPAKTLRHSKSMRDVSLTTAFKDLSLNQHDCCSIAEETIDQIPHTPSHIPRRKPSKNFSLARSASPVKSSKKTSKVEPFINKYSNVKAPLVPFDTESRLENIEHMYRDLEKNFEQSVKTTTSESNSLKETIGLYKARSRCLVKNP
jgi:hypothetical protein